MIWDFLTHYIDAVFGIVFWIAALIGAFMLLTACINFADWIIRKIK